MPGRSGHRRHLLCGALGKTWPHSPWLQDSPLWFTKHVCHVRYSGKQPQPAGRGDNPGSHRPGAGRGQEGRPATSCPSGQSKPPEGWVSWKRIGKHQLEPLSMTHLTPRWGGETNISYHPGWAPGSVMQRTGMGDTVPSGVASQGSTKGTLAGQHSHGDPHPCPWEKTQPWKTVLAPLKVLGRVVGISLGQTSDKAAVPSLGLLSPGAWTRRTRHLCSPHTVPTLRAPSVPGARLRPGLCKGSGAAFLLKPKPTQPPHARLHTTCAFSTHSAPVTKSPGGAGTKGHPSPTHLLLTVQCPSRSWSLQQPQRGQRPWGHSGCVAETGPRRAQ